MNKGIKVQRYNSTIDFVTLNNLEDIAIEVFGAEWEASDDVAQIKEIIKHLGQSNLVVSFIEGLDENNILVSEFGSKTVSYDDTRDIAIRTIAKLIELGHLKDCDDTYFEIQDTMQDEINNVLGLDIDDKFEVRIN